MLSLGFAFFKKNYGYGIIQVNQNSVAPVIMSALNVNREFHVVRIIKL